MSLFECVCVSWCPHASLFTSVCVFVYLCKSICMSLYTIVCSSVRPSFYVYVCLLCVLIYVLICARYRCRLLIRMTLSDGERRFAEYDDFAVGDEATSYRLYVGNCTSGDAGLCYMRIRNNYYPRQLYCPLRLVINPPISRWSIITSGANVFRTGVDKLRVA